MTYAVGEIKTEEGMNLLDRSLEESKRRNLNLVAARTLGQLRHESQLAIMNNDSRNYPDREAIILGKFLGKGGFSTVHELRHEPTVVCKFLSDDTLLDEQRIKVAAADIVREANFLENIHHEHIIAVRGIGSLDDMAKYYILLDKIQTPLSYKIEQEWGLATLENELLWERLECGVSIVQALKYLHHRKIVYRDLKIDNIGIDSSGKIVIYDFGLAKELKGESTDGKYKLTGQTGSWAYMAPEVAKHFKYNAKVDVYSFGIVLWELCSGKYAFQDTSRGDTLNKDERPPLVRNWPVPVEDLMKDCWHWNPNQRLDIDQVDERLGAIMNDAPSKRRSTLFSWLKST